MKLPPPSMSRLLTVTLWVGLALSACADESVDAPSSQDDPPPGTNNTNNPDGVNNPTSNNAPPTDPRVQQGAESFAQLCASCHGARAQGLTAPRLAGWEHGLELLVEVIDATMPPGATEACQGECADAVARYILSLDVAQEIDCDEGLHVPEQRLRLLTRREYANTVRDLLGQQVQTCAALSDCDVARQSCASGVCEADPCGRHTFTFDPGGRQLNTVHVAGTFNDWPGSLAEGGWPMTWVPELGLWVLKRELTPEQSHQYKFVLNEGQEWVTDPTNPQRADDGFGGSNSVLVLRCDGAGLDEDEFSTITAGFPPESRPEGYPFDNHAEGGRVTAVHVEEYMRAAELLASRAAADLGELLPCDPGGADVACLRAFVEGFGLRAFRRPLLAQETVRYVQLIQAQEALDDGVSVALQVMLSSPHFLYRKEIGQEKADGSFRLTPWETASALSYTFWGTMPDDALFEAADDDRLSTPAHLEEQARRMLADPRARDLVGTFAVQWLGVERVLSADKQPDLFHDFNRATRESMLAETRHFVTHVIFDGSRRFDELLTADYTFANDILGDFYGLGPVNGRGLQQTAYPDDRRSGLLGHGSVLASTAHSDQSSPILRGLFVRQRLLCQEFGTPPANAGGVPDVDPNATTRERFQQHSADPACHACHQYIDEIGFGFERFDAVGQYRQTENGRDIDATGNMNDVEGLGTDTDAHFEALPELARTLADSRAAKACFATQAWRFALGAEEREADLCTLEDIQARFEDSDYDIQTLLVAIVTSPAFTTRRAPE